ncbi:MAG TPA: hypothetical protein VN903_00930 [Polyangia bacterium]|jgi:hypothetical protein|nr:hypothetical protein [Polyangia bacterium]
MIAPILIAGTYLAAAEPAPTEQKPPEQKPLDARVEDLEREVERLKLQAPQSPEEQPGAAQAPAPAAANTSPNAFNPTITVVGNGLYRYDDKPVAVDGTRIDKTFNLREVELDLRAAVDPFADGVVILSVPSDVPGTFSIAVEEGFVTIKRLPVPLLDEPPLGLKLKVGRFRTEVGRINRLHLHDLPQVTRPLAAEEFLGPDGYIGNGISAQFFIPTPDDASAVELTAQALAGGGAAVADGPSRTPAVVGNLRWFRPFADDHNVDLSLIFNYGRTDPDGTLNAFTYSADFLYRWKPLRGGEFHSFVLGGQLFYSRRQFLQGIDVDGDGVPDMFERRDASPWGYFAWAQFQFARTVYLGVRWDETTAITDAAVRRRATSGYLTWYASEFLRFRLGYEHRFSDVAEEDGRNSVFAELNFIFGAHPPEPFWVNK